MEQDFCDWITSLLNGNGYEDNSTLLCSEFFELDIPEIPQCEPEMEHASKKRKVIEQQEERELKRAREQPARKFKEYIEFQSEIMKRIESQYGSVNSVSGLKLLMNDPKNGILQCHIHQNLSDGSIYLVSSEQIRTNTRGRMTRCNYKMKCLAHLHELFNESIYRRSPLLDAIKTGDIDKFFTFVQISPLC